MKAPVIQLRNPDGWYVFLTESREIETALGCYPDLARAIIEAIAATRALPRIDSPGFPEGVSDDFLEHVARTTSQYDDTCRALAAELVLARMVAVAMKRKLLGLFSKDFSA